MAASRRVAGVGVCVDVVEHRAVSRVEPHLGYRNAAAEEQPRAQAELDEDRVKLDGTCFGKMDTGNLFDARRQWTLRHAIAALLGVELPSDSVCAWGELMCNPGYYRYQQRGLAGNWVCFGVVASLPEPSDSAQALRWSELLSERGLAQIKISCDGRHARRDGSAGSAGVAGLALCARHHASLRKKNATHTNLRQALADEGQLDARIASIRVSRCCVAASSF